MDVDSLCLPQEQILSFSVECTIISYGKLNCSVCFVNRYFILLDLLVFIDYGNLNQKYNAWNNLFVFGLTVSRALS